MALCSGFRSLAFRCPHIFLIGIRHRFVIQFHLAHGTDNQATDYEADNAQRISHGIAVGYRFGTADAQFADRLLRRRHARRVGNGARVNASHHFQRLAAETANQHCGQNAQSDNGNGTKIEFQAAFFERSEKFGPT